MGENKNVILGGIAGVALLASAFMYFRSGEPTDQVAEVTAPENIKVNCGKCGESWDMPLSEYNGLKDKMSDGARKLTCTKCGANEMWKTSISLALPTPEGAKTEGYDLNVTNPTTEAEMNAPKRIKGGAKVRKD